MITIADLKQHLEQFDDDARIVFRADTERELYDDSALIDMRERLDFERHRPHPYEGPRMEGERTWGH